MHFRLRAIDGKNRAHGVMLIVLSLLIQKLSYLLEVTSARPIQHVGVLVLMSDAVAFYGGMSWAVFDVAVEELAMDWVEEAGPQRFYLLLEKIFSPLLRVPRNSWVAECSSFDLECVQNHKTVFLLSTESRTTA